MKESIADFYELSGGWFWPLVAAQLKPGFTKDDLEKAMLHAALTHGSAIADIGRNKPKVVYDPTGLLCELSLDGQCRLVVKPLA